MEIDIFPIPHRKDGIARNFDKVFFGILIITYIIAAFKTAQCIVGNDAEKEFVCFLLAISIFVGYYALFVLNLFYAWLPKICEMLTCLLKCFCKIVDI